MRMSGRKQDAEGIRAEIAGAIEHGQSWFNDRTPTLAIAAVADAFRFQGVVPDPERIIPILSRICGRRVNGGRRPDPLAIIEPDPNDPEAPVRNANRERASDAVLAWTSGHPDVHADIITAVCARSGSERWRVPGPAIIAAVSRLVAAVDVRFLDRLASDKGAMGFVIGMAPMAGDAVRTLAGIIKDGIPASGTPFMDWLERTTVGGSLTEVRRNAGLRTEGVMAVQEEIHAASAAAVAGGRIGWRRMTIVEEAAWLDRPDLVRRLAAAMPSGKFACECERAVSLSAGSGGAVADMLLDWPFTGEFSRKLIVAGHFPPGADPAVVARVAARAMAWGVDPEDIGQTLCRSRAPVMDAVDAAVRAVDAGQASLMMAAAFLTAEPGHGPCPDDAGPAVDPEARMAAFRAAIRHPEGRKRVWEPAILTVPELAAWRMASSDGSPDGPEEPFFVNTGRNATYACTDPETTERMAAAGIPVDAPLFDDDGRGGPPRDRRHPVIAAAVFRAALRTGSLAALLPARATSATIAAHDAWCASIVEPVAATVAGGVAMTIACDVSPVRRAAWNRGGRDIRAAVMDALVGRLGSGPGSMRVLALYGEEP